MHQVRADPPAEMAAKQAEIAVEQATEKLRERDQTEGVNFDATMVPQCPKCGAEARAASSVRNAAPPRAKSGMPEVRRKVTPAQVLPGVRAEDLAARWPAPVGWFAQDGASTPSGAGTATP